jgi:hypothetical protein
MAQTGGAAAPGKVPAWRVFLVWLLVVLAALFALLAPIAVWARFLTLNTATFTDTVAPLIQEREVAEAVAEETTRLLFENVNVTDMVEEGLPADFGFLGDDIADGIEVLTREISVEILQSQAFQSVWRGIISLAHSEAAQAITGKGEVQVTPEGEVVLDFGEVLETVRNALVDLGFNSLENVKLPAKAGRLVLAEYEELGVARKGASLLDDWYWVPVVASLLLFGIAVLVAGDRRKALLLSGSGLAIAMGLSLIAFHIARWQVMGVIEAGDIRQASGLVWDHVAGGLALANIILMVIGVLVVVGAAIAGPSRWAVALRRKVSAPFRS